MRDKVYVQQLRRSLAESGIAPRYIRRTTTEISEHLNDLYAEAIQNGHSESEAAALAREKIGSPEMIAEHLRRIPEFRCWIYRYPRIARVYFPVAYALLLPIAPVFAGLANPEIVLRWGAALTLSAGITACMLLFMQLAILLA